MKLLATDYDQTLKVNNQIDDETKELIKEFRAKGNLFAIVTGRTLRTIYEDVMENNIEFDFIVASNGAMIIDNQNNTLYENYIEPQVAADLVAFAQAHDFPYFVCSNGDKIYGKMDLDDPRALAHKKRHENNMISKEELLAGNMVSMVVRGTDQSHLDQIKTKIEDNFKNAVSAYKNLWVLDIMAKDVSKANGIKQALNYYKPDEIYVIGDDFNDIPMIVEFNGYCVSHAVTEVKAVALKQYENVKSLIKELIQL